MRNALFPGGHLPPLAAREPLGAAGQGGQRRRLLVRAADRQDGALHVLRLRQSPRPRLQPLGRRHRGRRHRGRALLGQRLLDPAGGLGEAQRRPERLCPANTALPRHRDPLEPPLPRSDAGQPAGGQRDRVSGDPAVHPQAGPERVGRRLSGRDGSRADHLLERPQLSAGRSRGRARRGHLFHRLAEPDHRPHAAQPSRSQPRPTARPRLPGRDGRRAPRPAGIDCRPAGGGVGGVAGRPDRPRSLPDADRTGRPARDRGGAGRAAVAGGSRRRVGRRRASPARGPLDAAALRPG